MNVTDQEPETQRNEFTVFLRRQLMATCQNCQAEGCSCFHPPNAMGSHLPGCEQGKDQ